jgi:hypothetical protein
LPTCIKLLIDRDVLMEKGSAEGKKYIPTERDKAFHEAGHTVTGYLFYSVDSVNIRPGSLLDMATHGSSEVKTPDTPFLGGAENENRFIDYLKIIICLRAGRHFQWTVSGIDDAEGAFADEDFLECFLYSADNRYYTPFDFISQKIVFNFCTDDRVVQMVVIIADALLKKGALSKEEIDDLLKDHIFDFEAILVQIKNRFYPLFCRLLKSCNKKQSVTT